ncbi:MAG TPA: aminotransferase class V-fold PLP-dependent enzyme [bacterium]|jgi:isopenicillin-N epimerase|nr:aminotransferase class V-fold PLP-dependent enzyme [bacterium]
MTNRSRSSAAKFRRRFLLRPDVIFLNHGSFGACPRPVFAAYQRWQRELERQPVEFLGRRFPVLMHAARAALAAYVGTRADNLVYVPNATVGLNVVARSLALRAGDEVLGTDHEYGALDRTWTFICERRGARYVKAAVPVPVRSARQVADAIWARVTPRTRVLFCSHIAAPTALIFPVREIVRRARAAGILTVIDGAHAPGQIPLHLDALGADFYAGNCHKWMCAPKGAGFLFARPEVQPLLSPLVVSWGWRSERPSGSPFVDEQEWQGTRDVAAYLAVPAAIEFLRRHRWDKVRARCHALAARLRGGLLRAGGGPLSPDSDRWYAQMVSVRLPAADAEAFQQRLYERFRIEVPVLSWNGMTLIRGSVQAYNSGADVRALLDATAALLPAP